MIRPAQSRCRYALVALLAGIAAPAAAQNYPAKSIRFIVAYAPGGGTDVTARPIAAKLSERYGQSVFVDNRAGGNGMIGADLVAKSAPDGYTVLVSASSEMSMNVALFSKMPYDPVKICARHARLGEPAAPARASVGAGKERQGADRAG